MPARNAEGRRVPDRTQTLELSDGYGVWRLDRSSCAEDAEPSPRPSLAGVMIACIQPEPGAGVCVCVCQKYIIARCSSNKRKTYTTRVERERGGEGGRDIHKGKSEGETKFGRENEFLAGNQI
jgi:hypothetical protein